MHEHHIVVGRTARYLMLGPENPAGIREVWVALHGYGQLAASFIRQFEPLDDGTRLILAPEALNRFYLVDVASAPATDRPVGAAWMTREDRDHEIADYVRYLDGVWGAVAARLPEQASVRLTVLGFSQGTATAARWVTLGAVRAEHLVLWGGLLPPELDLTRADHVLRRSAVHFVIGSRDSFVTEDRLAREETRLHSAELMYDVVRYAGGHGIKRQVLLGLARRLGVEPNG